MPGARRFSPGRTPLSTPLTPPFAGVHEQTRRARNPSPIRSGHTLADDEARALVTSKTPMRRFDSDRRLRSYQIGKGPPRAISAGLFGLQIVITGLPAMTRAGGRHTPRARAGHRIRIRPATSPPRLCKLWNQCFACGLAGLTRAVPGPVVSCGKALADPVGRWYHPDACSLVTARLRRRVGPPLVAGAWAVSVGSPSVMCSRA